MGHVAGFSSMLNTGVSAVCQLATVSGSGVFLSLVGSSTIRVKNLGGLVRSIELVVLVVLMELALLAKVGGRSLRLLYLGGSLRRLLRLARLSVELLCQ